MIEVILLLIGISAIYLFISLISFDPADPSWSQTALHEPIRNWGGAAGAYLSDIFLQFFGFAAYCVPFLVLLICCQLGFYIYRHYNQPINFFSGSLRVIGLLAFIFSLTGFLALNVNDWEQYQSGGILGSLIAGETFPMFGHLGSTLLFIALLLVSVTLLTSLSWLFILEIIGTVVVFIGTPILALFNLLFRKKEKPLSRKEREFDDLGAEENTQEDESGGQLELVEQELPIVEADKEPVMTDISEETEHNLRMEQELTNEVLNNAPQENETHLSVEDRDDDYVIDNSFPPVYSEVPHNATELQSPNFGINPDYYSPLTQDSDETEVVEDKDDEDSMIAPVGTYGHLVEDEPIIAPTPESRVQHFSPDDETEEPVVSESYISEHSSTYGTKNSLTSEDFDDFNDEDEDDDDNMVHEQEIVRAPVTKDNIHESLIHPLLMKNDKPAAKPTTPLPSLNLLTSPPVQQEKIDHEALKATAALIEKSLADFRVKARVVDYLPGPVITRFEIELAPGVKASRISTLDRDLARSLSMPSVRVVEVIPGKPYVGIELPNKNRQTVYFREVLDSPQFREAKSPLTVVLGKDISGQSVVADLAKMPHLLVAGTTGSGKSVGVNAMILSVLYKSKPEDVRFIMIDPKMLELSVYEGIPHLLTEVVTDMKDAANALNWCVNEMERRYRLMSVLGVRNIAGYNEKIAMAEEMGRPIPDPLWKPTDSMDIEMPVLEKLPYIIVMVDEFADLIMAVGKKVEELIARLAQKARAAGIHLVLATQRPSVDVITGLIKANIPTRIAFTVSSKIDSRTILDQMGAESLLGMGDMLYLAPNSSIPIRVHGAFVRDEEVHAVAQDWKARGTPKYIENITASSDDGDSAGGFDNMEEELDPLFDQVVAFVVDKRRASISSVQRQFRIGYNRAARIVEQMEMQGIVSAPNHSGNREVLAPPSHGDY
ncbi:hypothetical protein IPMB12_09500 [Zophobihabitans entericus]|uniref:DNA translocase FtsK n=2 Tax=Zophobihabitans entericus TaxID=1635327 RepID=A0A6G9IE11_9GAMM|nr:hypothetical protein IPMB12_09500 [Zophobihabitans entericus]